MMHEIAVRSHHASCVARAAFLEKVLGKQADILGAFPQSGHAEGNNLEPVIKILAHATFTHAFGKGTIGGRDDARIKTAYRILPHPPDAAVLQGAQQLDLHGGRKLSDLVQKQGAAVRSLP